MYSKLLASVREYKRPSLEAPVYVSLEVVMECIIPFIVAKLVNEIRAGCDMNELLKLGGILIVMAFLSLFFGIVAGNACSTASCGFARNLRSDLFRAVQGFSFENIDKFSTASLVTRLTTDVSDVQQAYMMIVRTAIRGPLMLVFSFVMALIMGGRIAFVFLFTAPFLAFGLFAIASWAMPTFRKLFVKYDQLNEGIQENIHGIRVVKAFVREDYEKKKFARDAENLCRDFTTAEKILALNNPMMQFCLYVVMIFVLYYGTYKVITSRGLDLNIGQISSLITYGTQILGSLMRLSMVFVMITLARESAVRIVEVLDEKPALANPVNGLKEIPNGEIEFVDVSFKYGAAKNNKQAPPENDARIASLTEETPNSQNLSDKTVLIGAKNNKQAPPKDDAHIASLTAETPNSQNLSDKTVLIDAKNNKQAPPENEAHIASLTEETPNSQNLSDKTVLIDAKNNKQAPPENEAHIASLTEETLNSQNLSDKTVLIGAKNNKQAPPKDDARIASLTAETPNSQNLSDKTVLIDAKTNKQALAENYSHVSLTTSEITAEHSKPLENDSYITSKTDNSSTADFPPTALRSINLRISSGSTIGIIGGTGSSKSTLIQLIPRLYDASSGIVKVGGHDVKDYDLEALRNNVAVVLQKNELFSGSIRDNLLWGNKEADEAEISEACRIACADEFIARLPEGYDTHIEQNGTNLSGGQKQRLCIARALLKRPKILILDDSTSAVDTNTDAKIRASLRKYMPEITKIIIAQRILSVQDADKIIVMEGGEIKATGNHEELLKSSGIYGEIYASQHREL